MRKTNERVVLVNNNPLNFPAIITYGVNGNGNEAASQGEAHLTKRPFEKWDKAMSISFLKLCGKESKQLPNIINARIIEESTVLRISEIFSKYNIVLTIGIPGSGCELSEIMDLKSGLLSLATARILEVSRKPELIRIIRTLEEINNKEVIKYPQFIGILRDTYSVWPGDFASIVRQSITVLKNELRYQTKALMDIALEFEKNMIARRDVKIDDKIVTLMGIESERDPELVGIYAGQIYGPNFRWQIFPNGNILFSTNFKEGISYLKERFIETITAEKGKISETSFVESVWGMEIGKGWMHYFTKNLFDETVPLTKLSSSTISSIFEEGLNFTLEKEREMIA